MCWIPQYVLVSVGGLCLFSIGCFGLVRLVCRLAEDLECRKKRVGLQAGG